MSYYLFFDNTGTFKGFTKEKEVAEATVEQRKYVGDFTMKKVKNRFFNDESKRIIDSSFTQLFDYNGIYLFPEEENIVEEKVDLMYQHLHEMMTMYLDVIDKVKFSDKELETVAQFTNVVVAAKLFMDQNEYVDEDVEESSYWESFRIDKIVMRVLKKYYKEGH